MLIFAHNEEVDPLIQYHRCTNTCVSRVNTDKSSWTKKKEKMKSSHTLTVCFLSVSLFFIFSALPKCKAVCQPWMKKKDGGRKNNTEKPTLTRVTHLVARVFVWYSFRQRVAEGPSLRQHWFSGRERRDGRRVPTTLPNRSHHSLLVGCCIIAETRHSPCSAGRCMRLQGRRRK